MLVPVLASGLSPDAPLIATCAPNLQVIAASDERTIDTSDQSTFLKSASHGMLRNTKATSTEDQQTSRILANSRHHRAIPQDLRVRFRSHTRETPAANRASVSIMGRNGCVGHATARSSPGTSISLEGVPSCWFTPAFPTVRPKRCAPYRSTLR